MIHSKLKEILKNAKDQKNDLGLDLAGINLSNINSVRYLINFLEKNPKFKALSVAETKLTSQGLEELTKFLGTDATIKKIILAQNNLMDADTACIVANIIGQNNSITEIVLSRNYLTSIGAGSIIQAIQKHKKNITNLDFSKNLLIKGDSDGIAKCPALLNGQHIKLKRLDLSSTYLGISTISQIALNLGQPETVLQILSLENIIVSEKIITTLAQSLTQNQSLRFLNCASLKDSKEGLFMKDKHAITLFDAVLQSGIVSLGFHNNPGITTVFYTHAIDILSRSPPGQIMEIFLLGTSLSQPQQSMIQFFITHTLSTNGLELLNSITILQTNNEQLLRNHIICHSQEEYIHGISVHNTTETNIVNEKSSIEELTKAMRKIETLSERIRKSDSFQKRIYEQKIPNINLEQPYNVSFNNVEYKNAR